MKRVLLAACMVVMTLCGCSTSKPVEDVRVDEVYVAEQDTAGAPGIETKTYEEDPQMEFYDAVLELVSQNWNTSYTTMSRSVNSVSNEFQTMRLIVSECEGEIVTGDYETAEVITDGAGTFVLQFLTVEATKAAYDKLLEDFPKAFVEEDYIITVNDQITDIRTYEGRTSEGRAGATASHLSYGAARAGVDAFINKMSTAQKQTVVTVAVIDTGIETSHPMFSGKLVTGKSFIGSSYNDRNGHGTHVSGIICDLMAGTAVRIMPVQVLDADGNGTMLTVASGVSYAKNYGAQVINLSLGGYDSSSNHYLDKQIQDAITAGVTVCAAAGNDSTSTDSFCPAHISSLLCVSAVDRNDGRAYFSNYGRNVGIAAPGVDIYSAYLGGRYASLSGTSMASPHVAACCALIRMSGLATSPNGIMNLLKQYADDRGSTGVDYYYGYGVINLANIPFPNEPDDEEEDPQPIPPIDDDDDGEDDIEEPQPTPPIDDDGEDDKEEPQPEPPIDDGDGGKEEPQPVPPIDDGDGGKEEPQPLPPIDDGKDDRDEQDDIIHDPIDGNGREPSNLSVSVSSSSSNGVGYTQFMIVTDGDLSLCELIVDGMDYHHKLVYDGGNQYHLDVSALPRGNHQYRISSRSTSSSGSFQTY